MANAAAGLVIALLAPLLGAIADRGGHRKRMLLAFTLLGAITTFALFFVAQGHWPGSSHAVCTRHPGVNGGIVFYYALLLDVARPADYDRVSSFGYALGYLGGGVLFALNVLMVVQPALFGLARCGSSGALVLRHRGGVVVAVHAAAAVLREGAAPRAAVPRQCARGRLA